MSRVQRRRTTKGSSLINSVINKLPFELHLPGYQYCGPRINLKKRLAHSDKDINPLDSACREHGITYDRSNSIVDRNEANHILENQAWERVKASDSDYKEKALGWRVTNAMKVKRKIGAGCGFNAVVKAAKKY